MEQINSTPHDEEKGITSEIEVIKSEHQGSDKHNHGDIKLTGTINLIKWAYAEFRRKKDRLLPIIGINLLITAIYTSLTFAGPVFFFIMPLAVILLIITQVITSYAMLDIVIKDSALNWKDELKKGSRNIPSLLWIGAITMFILFGGYVLLFIPGIYFLINIMFGQIAFIDKGFRGITALAYSKHIATGSFFAILGRFLLMALMMFGVILVIGFISLIIGLPFSFFMPNASAFISQLLNAIAGSIIGVLFSIALVKIYRELSTSRDSTFNNSKKPIYKMMIIAGLGWLIIPIILIGIFASIIGSGAGEGFYKQMIEKGMMKGRMMNPEMMQQFKDQTGSDIPGYEDIFNAQGEVDEAKLNELMQKYLDEANKTQ